jgi:hypothetical protein
MAYLEMVHRARVAKGKQNVTVYGICSDGMKYQFTRVGNQSQMSFRTVAAREGMNTTEGRIIDEGTMLMGFRCGVKSLL